MITNRRFLQFISALKIQLRVVVALFLRETRTTFGNSSLGYLWAIITPALGVAFLVIIFSFASRQPPFGQSLALFFATGLLTFEFYSKLSNSLTTVLDSNKALLVYPIVNQSSAILARTLLVTLTYLIIMCIFYGVLISSGLADLPAKPVKLFFAFLNICLLGFAVGILNLAIFNFWDSWIHVWKIINRPLFFISGIFFIPSRLPEKALNYLQWNPVLHLVESFRSSYYPNYDSRVLNPYYLIVLSLIFIFIGLFFERLGRRKSQK